MKLSKLYRTAVDIGISRDLRGKKEITRLLKETKELQGKLEGDAKKYFDADRLFNPYADSRILNGDPDVNVRKIMVGIDLQVGEVLLAHLLNRERKTGIDLLLSHHPEGYALAQLYDVMKLQSDLLSNVGVPVSVAEMLMEKRL